MGKPKSRELNLAGDNAITADTLKSVSILRNFTAEELNYLCTRGEYKKYPEGSYLIIENEPSRGMFIIIDGCVSVLKKDNVTDQLHRLTTLDSGEIIGELSLFDETPRTATIQAETETQAFHLDALQFEQFLGSRPPESQAHFYKTCAMELATRFRSLNDDYVHSQQLLWKHALRRSDEE